MIGLCPWLSFGSFSYFIHLLPIWLWKVWRYQMVNQKL